MRYGTVSAFDEARGLGEVTADDGAVFPFHSIELADGTRTIDVGAPVTFAVAPKLGRFEATAITRR